MDALKQENLTKMVNKYFGSWQGQEIRESLGDTWQVASGLALCAYEEG